MTPDDRRFLALEGEARDRGRTSTSLGRVAGLISPRSAMGMLREARGLATHITLYPLGLFESCVRGNGDCESGSDTFDLPVVLVHGYFHNRSGFYFLARALRKRGFRWVHGMNYNPLNAAISQLAARLSNHVDDILKISGAPRVHLVGHSLGGVIARWYVQEMGGADKVDHCVTIGTPHDGTYAAYLGFGPCAKEMRPGSPTVERLQKSFERTPTKFVNIYSDLDVLIVPPHSAKLPKRDNVHNHLLHDLGHTSMLLSPDLISLVTDHLAEADVRTPLAEVHEFPAERRTAVGEAVEQA